MRAAAATFLLLAFWLPLAQSLASETYRYFAYGSNVVESTMTSLRGLRPLDATAAVLPNYQLAFDIPGMPGVEPSAASVRPKSSRVVHGVLWTLTAKDFARIGRSEGVPFSYQWQACNVYPYVGDGSKAGAQAVERGEPIQAYTLRSPRPSSDRFIAPSASYLGILIRGAAEWQLDRDYQVYLGQVTTAQNLIVPGGLSGRLLQSAEQWRPTKQRFASK